MNQNIRLVALDMDGTLLNHEGQISVTDQTAIKEITAQGIEVVISTGRPYTGLPTELLCSLGVHYAITANGAGVYTLPDKTCLHASCMQPELLYPLLEELQKKDIHIDAFVHGDRYGLQSNYAKIDTLAMPQSLRDYIRNSGTLFEDLAALIRENRLEVEKMTLNFYPLADGSFKDRESVISLLAQHPEVTFLSGGYHNLEFTKTGTTKGMGLRFLCEHLGISLSQTMACGDTQNDIDILQTAAIGVAMGNADREVQELADYVTLTNEECGVAAAIHRFIGSIQSPDSL